MRAAASRADARATATPNGLWARVGALIDCSPSLRDLRVHGLQLLAARRWRAAGRPIPPELEREELAATFRTLAVPGVLEQVRNAYDAPIVVLKGPAVAAHFPDPVLRPFEDLDLLVADAPAAQAALEAAGFFRDVDPRSMANVRHHLDPLRSPNLPLHVELHSRPRWIEGLRPPPLDALLARAQPAELGVTGVLRLAPAHEAVLLAVHVWSHDPLTRLLRLVDVALLTDAAGAGEPDAVAREWGVSRIWRTTTAVVGSILLGGQSKPWPQRLWGRGLESAREATVLETHLGRCLSPFWILPPGPALRSFAAAVGSLVRPETGESWGAKLARVLGQVARPSMRRSEHLDDLAAREAPGDATD